MSRKAPLTDATIIATAKLVDDAQSDRREPSHSDLGFQINKAGLSSADPCQNGQVVGKAKRIRAVLSWSLERDPDAGEELLYRLVASVQGMGGFREGSSNFVGHDAIESLRSAFRSEGYDLGQDGGFVVHQPK